jgi:phosphate-selective porin OprO/OprP
MLCVVLAAAAWAHLWAAEARAQAEPDSEPSLFAPSATAPQAGAPANASTTFLHWDWLPGENRIMGLRWEDGLRYELGSEALLALRQRLQAKQTVSPLRGKIGLKLQLDAAAYATGGDLADVPSDAGLRLLRLYTSGSFFLLRPATFKLEVEINHEQQTHYLSEAYVEFSEIPVLQRLRVGSFRAPLSLEGYGGSSCTTFLSAAAPTEAFQPGIRYGIQEAGGRENERLTWAGGLFANSGDPDIQASPKTIANLIGRVTGLPYLAETANGPRLLHLGLGVQYTAVGQSEIRYRSRPESYFAPRLVDTGTISATQALEAVGEAAYARGPWSVQGELFGADVPGADQGDLRFWGTYLQGSWVLTGESRPYDRKQGVFKSIVPKNPFSFRQHQWGAWEVATRISCLDLNDGTVQGGTQAMLTAGLNLYLTANVCVMLDAAQGRVTDGCTTGGITVVQTRLKVEF